MALAYAHLRSLTQVHNDISSLLTQLNRFLVNETDHFVTLLFGRLMPGTGSFVAVNAGHPPGYVLDRCGQIKAQIGTTTLPLAVLPDAKFPCCNPVVLEAGDVVLLFTDGIPEAGPRRRRFGNSRMLEVVRAIVIDRPRKLWKRSTLQSKRFAGQETVRRNYCDCDQGQTRGRGPGSRLNGCQRCFWKGPDDG